jgi:hypothetical protein
MAEACFAFPFFPSTLLNFAVSEKANSGLWQDRN